MKKFYVSIKNKTVTIDDETCNFYEAGLYSIGLGNSIKIEKDQDLIEEHLCEREDDCVIFTDE